VHLVDHGVDGLCRRRAVIAPQFDMDRRAHDRGVLAEPAAGGLRGPIGGRAAMHESAQGAG
jgi:hypothetical protein